MKHVVLCTLTGIVVGLAGSPTVYGQASTIGAEGGGGGGGGGVAQIIAALQAETTGRATSASQAIVSATGEGAGEGGGLANLGISFGDSLLFLDFGIGGGGGGGGGGITEVQTSVYASSEEGGSASAQSYVFSFSGGTGAGFGGGLLDVSGDLASLLPVEKLEAQFEQMQVVDLGHEFPIPLRIGLTVGSHEVSPE